MDMNRKLIDYIPENIVDIRDIQAIESYAAQPEFERAWKYANLMFDELFIPCSQGYAVERWEKMLSISPKGNSTLDERKYAVYARIGEQRPYTALQLRQRLESLCGQGYSLRLEGLEMEVKVALASKDNFDQIGTLLERMLPCNILCRLSLMYNQHCGFARHSHEQMAQKKHIELREEVIS